MKELSELTSKELEAVFDANDKLQEEVAEDYEESQMDYIGDILEALRPGLTDWEVGFCSRPWVRYKDERDLFQATLSACADYGFLSDEMQKKIKYYLSRCNVLDEMDYNNRHYDELENYIERAGKSVASAICKEFEAMTDFNGTDLLDYFKEFYADERLSRDCYVDDDYILWEHVEYEKCYSSEKKRRAAC